MIVSRWMTTLVGIILKRFINGMLTRHGCCSFQRKKSNSFGLRYVFVCLKCCLIENSMTIDSFALKKEQYCQLSQNKGAPGVFTTQDNHQWVGVWKANGVEAAEPEEGVEPEEAAEPEAGADPEANEMAVKEGIENEEMVVIEALAADPEAADKPELGSVRQGKHRRE